MNLRVATDIGGTFTDLVCLDEDSGRILISKDPTTIPVRFQGIINCIKKAGIDPADIDDFIHGSTVAINALLEHKGADTCLITTKGFRDVFEIGHGQRIDMFNPFFHKVEPLITRENRFEVDERVDAEGNVLKSLDEKQAEVLASGIKSKGFGSVAVCLLNSYVNPVHEIMIGEVLQKVYPEGCISLSHQITREYREYERTSSVAINAYITPIVRKYLTDIEEALRAAGCKGQLLMMQSNGGTMSFDDARTNSISMIESGPASGVIAAAQLGTSLGYDNTISFDMGGTTAKASLIESGEPKFTLDYSVLGLPLLVPFIDLVEVGAGGGSIAWIEKTGALRVGPQSAGASPGPACYGWGGIEPTVTDANLHVGHLNPTNFLGGEIPLSLGNARNAIRERIAKRIGRDEDYCALGILEIANTIMTNGIRAVTVERGYDPRDCALVAYGGAGPLHASAMAFALGIPTVIIPPNPAHFSAMGMLTSDIRHDFAQTQVLSLEGARTDEVAQGLARMEQGAVERLTREGVKSENFRFLRSVDVRYQGQEHTLNVPLSTVEDNLDWKLLVRTRFEEMYLKRYGHSAQNEPLEMVTLRLSAIGVTPKPNRSKVNSDGRIPPAKSRKGSREIMFQFRSKAVETEKFTVYTRESLNANNVIEGPAIIEEYASTTIILPGYLAEIGTYGDIIIKNQAHAQSTEVNRDGSKN